MNERDFSRSIRKFCEFCHQAEVGEHIAGYQSLEIDREFSGVIYGSSEAEQFEYIVSKSLYNIRLTDGSVWQFSAGQRCRKLRYAMYPRMTLDENNGSVCGCHQAAVRYDYDEEAYVPGNHPASHLHIVGGCGVRLALRRVLSPNTFGLFLVSLFGLGEKSSASVQGVRANLSASWDGDDVVNSSLWSEEADGVSPWIGS